MKSIHRGIYRRILPGNTLRGRFRSKLRTKAWAVMLKICLGVKFTPSLTWKLNPPDMAPASAENKEELFEVLFDCLF